MILDEVVHPGVREGGLVPLVVPVAPVAEDIHHNVGGEPLAELKRQTGHVDHGFRVVAVHVEGMGIIFETSVGKKVDRASLLEVVKPIWLLMMM